MLLPHILIHQWMINILHYMLDHPVSPQHTIHWYEWLGDGINIRHSMIVFHWEIFESIRNKVQGILQTIIFAHSFVFKWFCDGNKRVKYIRYSMFDIDILGYYVRIFLLTSKVSIADILCYINMYFRNIIIHWNKGVWYGRKIRHYLLDLHCEVVDSIK